VAGREPLGVRAEFGVLLGEIVRAERFPAAAQGERPMPRSMRSGCRPASTRNVSATFNGEWFGSMIPPEPTRMVEVAAATAAIITSGLVLTTLGMLWCSASQ
jgi:hypothetical protein